MFNLTEHEISIAQTNNTENMLYLISCSVGHGLSMNNLYTASPVLGLCDPFTMILLCTYADDVYYTGTAVVGNFNFSIVTKRRDWG